MKFSITALVLVIATLPACSDSPMRFDCDRTGEIYRYRVLPADKDDPNTTAVYTYLNDNSVESKIYDNGELGFPPFVSKVSSQASSYEDMFFVIDARAQSLQTWSGKEMICDKFSSADSRATDELRFRCRTPGSPTPQEIHFDLKRGVTYMRSTEIAGKAAWVLESDYGLGRPC